MNLFYDDMTREEVCKAFANANGEYYGFTDHDFEWTDYYETAGKMSDDELFEWCKSEFG